MWMNGFPADLLIRTVIMKTYAVCFKDKAWLGSMLQCLSKAKNLAAHENDVVKVLRVRANEPAVIIFDIDKSGIYPVESGRKLSYAALKKALKRGKEK